MAEQPACLAHLIARRQEIEDAVGSCFRPATTGVVIAARGSSDHAATVGRYLLEVASGRPVASAAPSVHLLYGTAMDFSGYVVIGASQSGRTPEIARLLERAKACGGRTIAITNEPASPLAAAADVVVELGAGEERAVPATKTVTAEIVAFALVAAATGDLGLSDEDWSALPAQVAEVVTDREPCRRLAGQLTGAAGRLATVARGYLYGAAAECALKIEETTSLLATAFSAADLRHGPIAIASSGIPVLVLSHPGPAAADVADLAAELRRRGAVVHLLGPVAGTSAGWPAVVPEPLAPVLAVVRGQQVALELARLLGRDPDAPEGLTKVTVT